MVQPPGSSEEEESSQPIGAGVHLWVQVNLLIEPGVGPFYRPLVPVCLNGAQGCLPKCEGVAPVLGLCVTAAAVLFGDDDGLRLVVDAEDAREGFGGGLNLACLRKAT